MAYQAFKENYFKNMIKAAKIGSISYAFGFDKEGGQHCFVLDDALGPKELFNKVKSEKGIGAGGYGACIVQGTAFLLTPEKKISGMKKMLITMAKSEGWLVKQVKVVGEEEEEGSEIESNETAAPAPAAATAPEETESEESEAVESGGGATPGQNEEGSANEEFEDAETENAENGDGSDLTAEQLTRQASTITKSVEVWNKSTVVATKDLRKLQKAILDLKDPRSAPVIKGLEGILKRLDTVDEEAAAVAAAASSGDGRAFDRARDTLVAKLKKIQAYVENDELIKDAEANPLVKINIAEILGKSIQAILRVLA